jgi:hypothetical protein
MELNTHLTPGSCTGILEVLGNVSNSQVKEILESRLAEIGLDSTWLTSISARYIEVARSYPDHKLEYGVELLDLVTWLCAPLRGNNLWLQLNDEIQTKYSEIIGTNELQRDIPVSLNCWVACVPIGGIERNYPILLNTRDSDTNLHLAFTNLIKHALAHDWENGGEEIDSTSIALRLTGIVNAIDPTNDLRGAFTSLVIKLKGTLPQNDDSLFRNGKWISDLIETRNIVAHIGSSPSGLSLQDAWDRSRDLDQIKQIIRLTTYLVANDIRERLLNTDGKNARAWAERVEEEIGWLIGAAG